jgi:monofunctional biosynthetic peptidoglycan transglycosylase
LTARRLLLLAAAVPVVYAAYVAWGLPRRAEVRALAKARPERTGVMRQREAEARARGRKPRHVQTWVPLSRVSRHLIHAVVVAEDPNFFGHEGVDWDAVKESLDTNVRKRGFVRGGSTITQQLAKNLFFTTHKSITRKLRELLVAHWLEDDLGKRRILELYLNVIEWGDGIYGAEAAALRYYGKPAASLDEVEAAGLAAMVPSPRRINPSAGPARHARAQKRVLWLMARAGYVRRSVAGVGAEPPPPEPEEEEDEEAFADDGTIELTPPEPIVPVEPGPPPVVPDAPGPEADPFPDVAPAETPTPPDAAPTPSPTPTSSGPEALTVAV